MSAHAPMTRMRPRAPWLAFSPRALFYGLLRCSTSAAHVVFHHPPRRVVPSSSRAWLCVESRALLPTEFQDAMQKNFLREVCWLPLLHSPPASARGASSLAQTRRMSGGFRRANTSVFFFSAGVTHLFHTHEPRKLKQCKWRGKHGRHGSRGGR